MSFNESMKVNSTSSTKSNSYPIGMECFVTEAKSQPIFGYNDHSSELIVRELAESQKTNSKESAKKSEKVHFWNRYKKAKENNAIPKLLFNFVKRQKERQLCTDLPRNTNGKEPKNKTTAITESKPHTNLTNTYETEQPYNVIDYSENVLMDRYFFDDNTTNLNSKQTYLVSNESFIGEYYNPTPIPKKVDDPKKNKKQVYTFNAELKNKTTKIAELSNTVGNNNENIIKPIAKQTVNKQNPFGVSQSQHSFKKETQVNVAHVTVETPKLAYGIDIPYESIDDIEIIEAIESTLVENNEVPEVVEATTATEVPVVATKSKVVATPKPESKPAETVEKTPTCKSAKTTSESNDDNSSLKVSESANKIFLNRVKEVADSINCDYKDLLAVMNAESNLNEKAVNKISGATGLIQFMPSTANGLGTTTKALFVMSKIEQMDYVEKYLLKAKKAAGFDANEKLSAADLYALIFLPARANRHILTTSNEIYYKQNHTSDLDGDGQITKDDLHKRIVKFSVNESKLI